MNPPAQDDIPFPFPPSRPSRFRCKAMHWWSILGALLIASSHAVAFDVIRDYSGSTFFDGWDFYGNLDNLTLGTSLVLGVYLASTVLIILSKATLPW